MIRVLIEGAAFFLLPFVLFAVALALRRRNLLDPDSWSPHLVTLAAAGLLLVISSLVYAGLFAEQHTGAFVPAHLENGRVVPGEVR